MRNRIHGAGLRAYRPYQGNVLTRHHRQARMLWANQHQAWTLRNHWRHVWFSVESRFLQQRHDGRRRVYRRRGERYAAPYVDEAPPHGDGGVTVWGAISNTGRSQLVRVQGNLTAAQYIQDILQPHVLPLMGTPGAVFQTSHSPYHCGLLQQSEHPHSALAITKPRSKPNRTFVGRTGPTPQSAKCPPPPPPPPCNTR